MLSLPRLHPQRHGARLDAPPARCHSPFIQPYQGVSMRLPLFVAAAALLAGTAACTQKAAPGPDISLDTLKTVTQTLSSDDFEGRAPATVGEEKTIAYIIERMKAAGLQPS